MTAVTLLRELDHLLTTLQNFRSCCASGCDLEGARPLDDAARLALNRLLPLRRPLMNAATSEEVTRASTPPGASHAESSTPPSPLTL